MKSFVESTEAFLEQAKWLTDVDLPMTTSLRQAAAELDANGVQAALLNTYGVTYRALLKRAGDKGIEVDPDEDFLDAL